MKLTEAIKSNNFYNEQHKASVNILYTAWFLKSQYGVHLKKYNLSQEQFNVLRIIKGSYPKPISVKEIAARLIEKNSNVPRIIDKLEAKKWVNRNSCKNDARVSNIELTEDGLNAITQLNVQLTEITQPHLGITEQEAVTLNAILDKIATKK